MNGDEGSDGHRRRRSNSLRQCKTATQEQMLRQRLRVKDLKEQVMCPGGRMDC
jgi:hypothetical protein